MHIKWLSVNHSYRADRLKSSTTLSNSQAGVTLIELIVFMVVTAIIAVTLASVFRHAMTSFSQPIINNQMVDMAYSQLNDVLSRRFDENSPDDGTPCDITIPCAGFGLDSGENSNNPNRLDDVDDFDGYIDNPASGFTRTVTVTASGSPFGIQAQYVKRITVSVVNASGDSIAVTAYKVNQ